MKPQCSLKYQTSINCVLKEILLHANTIWNVHIALKIVNDIKQNGTNNLLENVK